MIISKELIENSQIALSIEMEPGEMDKHLDNAYSNLVKKVSVPGFRKGKTPKDVLERHIGKQSLVKEALDNLIPEAYEDAVKNQEIEPIAQPEIEIIQTEPVIFKAIIPIKPTAKLGDYKEIRVEANPMEIGDNKVEEMIEYLRNQQAILIPADRPIQSGDTVTMKIAGENEGETFLINEEFTYEVDKEARLPLPGFGEKLEGLSKGEDSSFVLSYPDDYEIEEMAGKEYGFNVTINEVKEKKLPKLDDEFAKSLSAQDVESLRTQIYENLKAGAEERSRVEFEQKVIDAVVEISNVEYPPVLTDREIDQLLNEETRNFAEGMKGLENYLKSMNKTIDEHREELRPVADKRVVRLLLLEKLSEEEKIEVSTSEIDDEIEEMTKDAGEQSEEMKKLFNLPQSRESIELFLIRRKTMELLVKIARGSDEIAT